MGEKEDGGGVSRGMSADVCEVGDESGVVGAEGWVGVDAGVWGGGGGVGEGWEVRGE